MARIWIDGVAYEADPAKNLLEVCLSKKLDLPYFCWHPAMGSIGACRQCAVKQLQDESDESGKLVMACMTPAADGTRIAIEDPEARAFRASVIEWLMLNHPHDCPVCDEGGECHLQDMTVMSGHVYRRYRFEKRTYENQELGPFVTHQMNRCIQCYRCVRFYRDHAGGRDLHAMAAHDHVYFGRAEDGTLESEFAGNLVEVCPTGVFTDKTLGRHYTRKWDLRTAPSVCVHCSLGCNLTPGERYGSLRRVRARYHSAVNGYFLCDRGRYGYEFVNDDRRLRAALLPKGRDEPAERIGVEEATERLRALSKIRVIGIGSPRASLESNFALKRLVGSERFFQGVSSADASLMRTLLRLLGGPSRSASLADIRAADAVFVLGEEVADTAPVAALALRQAARNVPVGRAVAAGIPRWHDSAIQERTQGMGGPFFVATTGPSRLEDLATTAVRRAPEDLARLGFAVAHCLDRARPAARDLPEGDRALAERIAAALAGAERPLILSGTGTREESVMEAAAASAWSCGACLSLIAPSCNSVGLALLADRGLDEAFATPADAAIILETDLFHAAERTAVERFLEGVKTAVVIDHLAHETGARADLLLPAATFAECHGTLVSSEGRAQRFFAVFPPEGPIRSGWRWLAPPEWKTAGNVVAAMAAAEPSLARVEDGLPEADLDIPREPSRSSGRTAARAHLRVIDQPPPVDVDSPYTFSMEGRRGAVPGNRVAEVWAPGWSSVQSLTRFQEEVGGPLRGGETGIRLLGDGEAIVAGDVPAPFQPEQGRLRVVPRYHVFGSEPLSLLAKGIGQRAPSAYVALSPADAEVLEVGHGDVVRLSSEGRAVRLPVVIDPGAPEGVAGLPIGLPEVDLVDPPRWMEVERT